MKKNYIILITTVLVITLGIVAGVLINNKKASNLQQQAEPRIAYEQNELENRIEIVTTSYNEEKTTPNTLLIFKTYYKKCEHIQEKKKQISEELVNKTEEELQEEYKNWNIENFTKEEVSFYREVDEICNEHYIIKENNGYVTIYFLNEKGEEILNGVTEIVTAYLPQEDQEELKEGIKIIGRENLNSRLEDYE